jgi:hypothetical protein
MRLLPRKLTASRARRVATATVSTLLICAFTALGFWVLFSSGTGSSAPTQLGTAPASTAYVITPSFAANVLKPTTETPLKISVTNNESGAVVTQIKKLSYSITVDGSHPGCLAEWFKVESESVKAKELFGTTGAAVPVPIPVAASTDFTAALGSPTVLFRDVGIDQKACLNAAQGGVGATSAQITVTLNGTP